MLHAMHCVVHISQFPYVCYERLADQDCQGPIGQYRNNITVFIIFEVFKGPCFHIRIHLTLTHHAFRIMPLASIPWTSKTRSII